jgi:hypothetical protein
MISVCEPASPLTTRHPACLTVTMSSPAPKRDVLAAVGVPVRAAAHLRGGPVVTHIVAARGDRLAEASKLGDQLPIVSGVEFVCRFEVDDVVA